MQYLKSLTIILAVSIAFVACSEETQQDMEQERDEFITEAENTLDSLEQEMEEIEVRLGNADIDTTRQTLRRDYNNMRADRTLVEQDLQLLRTTDDDDEWEELKSDINDQLESLEDSWNEFMEELDLDDDGM